MAAEDRVAARQTTALVVSSVRRVLTVLVAAAMLTPGIMFGGIAEAANGIVRCEVDGGWPPPINVTGTCMGVTEGNPLGFSVNGTMSSGYTFYAVDAKQTKFTLDVAAIGESYITLIDNQAKRYWATAPGIWNFTVPGSLLTVLTHNSVTLNSVKAEPVLEPDEVAPVVPTGLAADAGLNAVTLTWDANSEPDFSTYIVYVDGSEVGRTWSASYTAEGLAGDQSYEFGVSAVDMWGNESATATVTATPYGPDIQPPSVPQGLQYVPLDGGIRLTWTANGEPDLAGYRVYIGGELVEEVSVTEASLAAGEYRAYDIGVSAVDTSGNESAVTTITAYPIDPTVPVIPPNAPGDVTAIAGSTRVELTWNAPDGGGAVESYRVYRDGTLAGTTQERAWTDSGLKPRRTYRYAVSATNTVGESPRAQVAVTTTAPGVIEGVTTSLAGLGQRLQEGIRILLPIFLVAAGIVIARIVLRTGFTWFQAQRRGN